MKKLVLLASCMFLVSACGQKPSEAPAQPIVESNTPSRPSFTAKEWRHTFNATFAEENPKTDEDGITSYGACFEKSTDGKCSLFATGKRDTFRKLDHLIPLHTVVSRSLKLSTHVGIYLATVECKPPSLLVVPSINEKGDWLFLEKAAFMADGDVVLEHNFDYDQVDRNNVSSWIHEDATFLASDAELLALERFVSAKTQIIRLTGKKGYLTVAKDTTANSWRMQKQLWRFESG